MTLQQLIYVVTVADQASINQAAKLLFISQSSLSAAVLNLEKEIGISIFRRSNRGVVITPEGEEFLLHARQIVEQYHITEEKYIYGKTEKKSFRVSTQHYTFAVKAFIEMARQFSPDEYALGIYECKTSEILHNVAQYKSELGVLYLDDFNRPILERLIADHGLIFEELFTCSTYVFLCNSHPLAKKKVLTLDDLSPYPNLAFDQGEEQAFYLSEEVSSTYLYRQQIRVSDRATMLNLMVGLNGYTLCSGIMCEDLNGENYCVVPLDSDQLMHIGYVHRADSRISPLASLYIEELKKSSAHLL